LQAVGECVAAELAPEIAAAAQHLAVPIDLRFQPQLPADRLRVVHAVLLAEFLAGRRRQPAFAHHPLGVADR
jgi:hypothetical protein